MKTKTPSIKTVILSLPDQQMIGKCLKVYILYYFISLGIDDLKFLWSNYCQEDSSDLVMKVRKTTRFITPVHCYVIGLNEQNGKFQFLLQQTWKIMKNMHSDACYNHLLVWLRAIYVLDGWINMML